MTDEAKQEFTRRITTANKSELVVILFDMFERYAEDAIMFSDEGKKDAMAAETGRARNVVLELINSLDRQYDISNNLYSIYRYVDRLLIDASVRRDVAPIKEAKDHMKMIGESFRKIAKEDTDTPLMQNAEPVYAGMTYGSAGVNETGAGVSRGFLA